MFKKSYAAELLYVGNGFFVNIWKNSMIGSKKVENKRQNQFPYTDAF